MEFNAEDFKCRCSSIHSILANSRSSPTLTDKQRERLSELRDKVFLTPKMIEELAELEVKETKGSKIVLSDTCIAYLMDEYAWETQQMVRITKEVMDIPHMQKGTFVEQESLGLVSIVDKVEYKENKNSEGNQDRIENDFLCGKPDAYLGEALMTAEAIIDAKSQWDYPTFLCKTQEPLSNSNSWQLKGYGNISGAKVLSIANCLVTTPEHIVYDMKNRLLRKMNAISDESPEFVEKWAIMERSMTFDNIPIHQRVFKKKVEPMTEEEKIRLYDRVKNCREWLNDFHETYQKLNK